MLLEDLVVVVTGAGPGLGTTLGLDGISAFLRPRAWHLRTQP